MGGPLAPAVAAFAEIQTEVERVVAMNGEPQEGALVPPEEVKKTAKWLQQTITKFGATAAVSEGPKDTAVVGISKEVVRSCMAVVNTLLCLATRGACSSLLTEIRDMGGRLATTISELGQAVGTPEMARNAGKTLDSIKHLERISTTNRASIRRRLLKSLAQLRDAHRELNEELAPKDPDADEFGLLSDDEDLEVEIGPEERQLAQALVILVGSINAVAEQASRSCMQNSGVALIAIVELEALAAQMELSSIAIDGLASSVIGGLDIDEFKGSLQKMQTAVACFGCYPEQAASAAEALRGVQAALEAIPPES